MLNLCYGSCTWLSFPVEGICHYFEQEVVVIELLAWGKSNKARYYLCPSNSFLRDMFCIVIGHFVDYPVDLSADTDKPGRVCAQSCDGYLCSSQEICEEMAESEPACVCPGQLTK